MSAIARCGGVWCPDCQPIPEAEAVIELRRFIAEATEALTALEANEPYGDDA